MGTEKDSEKTKANMIEAAGKLFAEKGFKGVTVREIVKEANANLSALNYHFGSKDNLYQAAIIEACKEFTVSDKDIKYLLNMKPYDALYVLTYESLKEYKKGINKNWKGALLSRESNSPTQFFDDVVNEYFKPRFELTSQLFRKIADNPEDDASIEFASFSLNTTIDTIGGYSEQVSSVAPSLMQKAQDISWIAKQILDSAVKSVKSDHRS